MNTITDLIYKYKNIEFKWGENDCCTFAADIAWKFKGKNPPNIKEIFNYKDLRGSIKWMNKVGAGALDEVPEKYLGLQKKNISEVKHGDIVYYMNENGQGIMGICNGCRAYFLQYGGGVTARPVEDCTYCWSVE
jgi:hypothetical protein